jgi:hypothetical protein
MRFGAEEFAAGVDGAVGGAVENQPSVVGLEPAVVVLRPSALWSKRVEV